MSEGRALTYVFAATVAITTAVCAALMVLHVGGLLIAVAMIVVGGLGADTLSRVVMHYPPPERRRH
jgi:hypothetical protein